MITVNVFHTFLIGYLPLLKTIIGGKHFTSSLLFLELDNTVKNS